MTKPDYMSDAEYKDLEDMKEAIRELKIKTWDYLTAVQAYNPTDLLHSGYRNYTNAQAIEKILCETNVKIAKMHREYLEKYPD